MTVVRARPVPAPASCEVGTRARPPSIERSSPRPKSAEPGPIGGAPLDRTIEATAIAGSSPVADPSPAAAPVRAAGRSSPRPTRIAAGGPRVSIPALHRRSDYQFDLPAAQIAQHPAARRDGSRLLVVPPAPGPLADRAFTDLPDALPPEAVVIVNDTRVVPARVLTHKATGGAVELLFVEPVEPGAATAAPVPPGHGAWRCLARARRPLRPGQLLHPEVPAAAAPLPPLMVVDQRAADGTVAVAVPGDVHGFLDAHGQLPLPPYIERAGGPSADDRERYQTLFARDPGAVAAPTAGLHFTPAVLDALAARGATVAPLTLHVGLGTFAPVRGDDLARHVMHVERFTIPAATAGLVESGRPVVAVGTTVVRALESAATGDHRVAPGPGRTALFIRPGTGFRFRVVDHLVTNFHLPESTLLMLVCTFAGVERILGPAGAYRHAVAAGYRFFSYGDAMLVARGAGPC